MKIIIVSAIALSMAAAAGVATARRNDHHWRPHHDNHRFDRWHSHGWQTRSDWRRGGRIGWSDWRRGHEIDYRAHHLRRPPHGYAWRDVDGKYVLAAVASGVIADIILNER